MVECRSMKKPLKERLKYWHIRCSDCDNKLAEIEKEKTFDKEIECSDCKQKVLVKIGIEVEDTIWAETLCGKRRSIHLINCTFVITKPPKQKHD